MEIRRLKYFIATAKELSFSEAARRLGVGQPVLSRGIKELESSLGTKLLNRPPGDVSLTEAGEVLLPNAEKALQILDDSVVSIREIATGKRQTLHIGYLPIVFDAFVAEAMSVLHQAHASLVTKPHEMSTQRQIEALRGGKLDVAIVNYYQDEEITSEFDTFDICTTPMGMVVSRKNPISKLDRISLDSVEDQNFIAYGESDFPICNKAAAGFFKSEGHPFSPLMYPDSLHAGLAALATGNTFTFMSMIGSLNAPRHVKYLRIDQPGFQVHFCGLVRRDEHRRTVLKFLQECRRNARQILENNPAIRVASSKEKVPL
jgi:DNA-binding transcriptional LysR family regulator